MQLYKNLLSLKQYPVRWEGAWEGAWAGSPAVPMVVSRHPAPRTPVLAVIGVLGLKPCIPQGCFSV